MVQAILWSWRAKEMEIRWRSGGTNIVEEMISHHLSVALFLESVCFPLQYEYDTNETGDRVVLGRGTYGVVYAGRDLSNQVRIAIKEIPERDSRQVKQHSLVFFMDLE